MTRGVTIHSGNVHKIFYGLSASMPQRPAVSFMMPARTRIGINRRTYKGRGRPRKEDYRYMSTVRLIRKMAKPL